MLRGIVLLGHSLFAVALSSAENHHGHRRIRQINQIHFEIEPKIARNPTTRR